ncbi:MAG TPA: erythritol/L-threitol dehydrogenase, partial [Lachnospiraceae bacterium]|nr:erythritol/L-threitol dehydrogenase [Lachnospiraceae bacterium]
MSNLPEKMKAVVAYAPGDYRLEMVDTPKAGEGEMILKVEACGICAGDVKAFDGAASFWGFDGQPKYIKAPMIPGHEFVGTVVEMGPNVKGNWKIGDRICPEQIVPCGECMFCKTGRHWMCEKHDLFGFQNNVNGGMAEYVKLTKEALPYMVPADMPIEKAALIEPYACSFHCVERAQVKTTDVVVLSGAGTLGLGMVGAIRQANPKCFIVLDMNETRLAKAKEFGADIVMNPAKEDVVAKIKELTNGYGCDIYIEA